MDTTLILILALAFTISCIIFLLIERQIEWKPYKEEAKEKTKEAEEWRLKLNYLIRKVTTQKRISPKDREVLIVPLLSKENKLEDIIGENFINAKSFIQVCKDMCYQSIIFVNDEEEEYPSILRQTPKETKIETIAKKLTKYYLK